MNRFDQLFITTLAELVNTDRLHEEAIAIAMNRAEMAERALVHYHAVKLIEREKRLDELEPLWQRAVASQKK